MDSTDLLRKDLGRGVADVERWLGHAERTLGLARKVPELDMEILEAIVAHSEEHEAQ